MLHLEMFDSEMIDLEMLHLEMFDFGNDRFGNAAFGNVRFGNDRFGNALHLIIGERDPGATFMRARIYTYVLIGYSQSTHAQGIALRVLSATEARSFDTLLWCRGVARILETRSEQRRVDVVHENFGTGSQAH